MDEKHLSLRAGHRHLRLSRHRADGDRLLHRPGPAAPDVQAGAGQVQGPHRDPQGQRLPVAAHDAGGAFGRERRIPDADRGDAPGGRIGRGRALALQGKRARWRERRPAGHQVAAVAAGHPARDARRRRVLGSRQDRPLPRRGLRLHAQEPDHGPAARRDGGRFRIRDPQQHRRPHGGRQDQRRAGAAAHRAEERRRGRSGHGARCPRPIRPGWASCARAARAPRSATT